jgi:hypothetical protein
MITASPIDLRDFFVDVKAQINKSFLFLYRVTAIIVLYGVLIMVGGYLFMQGFYVCNHSWIAPMIVSPSDDQILQMTSQMITNRQLMENFTLDRNRLRGSLDTIKQERLELMGLDKGLYTALRRRTQDDAKAGRELEALLQQKRQDIANTRPVIAETQTVEARIEKDLKAGLITKGDAATQRASLTQFVNSFTDDKVAEVLLRDNVRQKTTKDIDTLDILAKRADLQSQVAQQEINISIGEQQLASDQKQINELAKATKQIKESPYFIATQAEGDVKFAFVPYDNSAGVQKGTPLYGCYLNMLGCQQVGTIKAVFKDEQKMIHPLFKSDVRGFLVQLDLTNLESAKSKTLFLGRKPLFF